MPIKSQEKNEDRESWRELYEKESIQGKLFFSHMGRQMMEIVAEDIVEK